MNKLNESADLIDKYMDRNIQIERILKESLDDLGNIADSIVQSRPAVAMNIYAIKNKIFKAWRKARSRNINGKKYINKLMKCQVEDKGVKHG